MTHGGCYYNIFDTAQDKKHAKKHIYSSLLAKYIVFLIKFADDKDIRI